jgi:hypothetical protein
MQAAGAGVRGKDVTPFLLARLAQVTGGKTLRANQALIIANARLAARVACALGERPCNGRPSGSDADGHQGQGGSSRGHL